MVQVFSYHSAFPRPVNGRLFYVSRKEELAFPIKVIEINWDILIDKRPMLFATIEQMPTYLLHPEILILLEHEAHPTYRLIMDLMWTTGMRISEVLSLTPNSFIDDGNNVAVIISTPKKGPGRPTKSQQKRSIERRIPIKDNQLIDRLNCYVRENPCRNDRRMFTMCRQTVNRHIEALVERVGGAPFRISAHTFRHSFAIHLMLHGRPLKYISQLLGHRSIQSMEIYTNVLTFDESDFLEGVNFH